MNDSLGNKTGLSRVSIRVVQNVWSYLSLQERQGRSLFSLLAVVLYLCVQAMACAAGLHHFVHHDSDKAEHQCAATVLSYGQVDLTAVEVSVARSAVLQGEFSLPAVPVLVAVEYRLLPERAPPSLLS